ncbi:MAG: single-stranded DNA-binding protein [Candidatus Marinimicrobia bacterium]|jgi:single-strand DNA-binding protein|nr:single-stranded DNA-binding protein [Candidatus Neomarinimicrobiota bacterium]|tara:strand:- start:42 stop:452 length:411 start_codon:yes stop_codon:yes gene_type:complete
MQKGSVNRVMLAGHLGGDPESRFTPSGAAVTNFTMATNETFKNSDGEYQDRTEWHRCVLWGKSAEVAGELLKKGQLTYVEGRLQTRSWEDKNGVKRYTTEVVCDNFTMLGRRSDNQGANSQSPDGGPPKDEDDLPF